MQLLFISLFVFMSIHISSQNVNYVDCGSYLKLQNLTVEGCASSSYCPLYIGENPLISFVMNTGVTTINSTLSNDVSVIVRGTKFELSVTPELPCDILKCPLEENSEKEYEAKVHVDERFGPITGTLQWIMKHEHDQILCFEFSIALRYSLGLH